MIAERVCQGSMKQLRDQVILDFKYVNRRYRGIYANNTLLQLICQEGFYDMLVFLMDEKNHSVLDDQVLDIVGRNERDRTSLHLCFTPPSLTYNGQKYGIDSDTGLPNCQRPDGIEVQQDWIKPGGPRMREKCVAHVCIMLVVCYLSCIPYIFISL